MKKTKTSEFGVSRREAHDSSAFYERNLYGADMAQPLDAKQLAQVPVPPPGAWTDQIYHASSAAMTAIPDNSVALAFTSPPYNVGKSYDDDLSLQAYFELIHTVGSEIYRVLRPGGRYVINIANLGRKPYIPLHAYFYDIHTQLDFLPMGEIIWQKAAGASGNCAWGSWMSAKAPRLRDLHEYLLVFAKQAYSRPDRGQSDIERDEFLEATLSIWQIPAESAKRVGHPAPFPVDLAARVIQLYSYSDDVVLDPFAGSGTTCVAAAQLGRHYVGYELAEEYCVLARRRVAEEGRRTTDDGRPAPST